MKRLLVATLIGCFCSAGLAQTTSPLFARGYTVVPTPQKVSLANQEFSFDRTWQLKVDTSVPKNDVAVEVLRDDLESRFNLKLGSSGASGGVLTLRIVPGSVQVEKPASAHKSELEEQAYRIDLQNGSVTVTANASTGLLYGVETLIQLLKPTSGSLRLPEGSIEDWPDLQLRIVYWDDSNHLEHMDELKRYMRQAAFYKINAIELKLDGHFQYRSAPALVEPYALSPAELQDLTNYGLRYHVQLIPYLDGPAHIAFVLKHPEYYKLRAFPDSNYEMCVANPDTYKLLEGMYQDLMDANKGVKYFYVAMDEPYFVGLARNSQCNEADSGSTPGQVFTQFLTKAGNYLHNHGRTVMFWGGGGYPLTTSDVASIPPYFIADAYGGTRDQLDIALHQRGFQQILSATYLDAGDSSLFPLYFGQSETQYPFRAHRPPVPNIVSDIMGKVSFDFSRLNTDTIGEVTSGWADKGMHTEPNWLGYIAGGAAGWHTGMPSPQELESSFYFLFYGERVQNMDRVYRLMSEQDQEWTDSWDTVPSKVRKPIWGGAYGKIYKDPKPAAEDQAIPLPPSPDSNLSYTSTWSKDNAKRIALAIESKQDNDNLVDMLYENMRRAQFNQYNLEVFLSIAKLYRQNLDMITGIHDMDLQLTYAAQIKDKDPQSAIDDVDSALDIATSIWQQRNKVLADDTTTWYKSWFPRVEEANGRKLVHELDDVKDHIGDRTVDMSYLVNREKLLPFGEWVNSIVKARNEFAAAHNLPATSYQLSWDDLSVTPVVTGLGQLRVQKRALRSVRK